MHGIKRLLCATRECSRAEFSKNLEQTVPIVEAMMGLVLMDHALRHRGQLGRSGPVQFPNETGPAAAGP